MSGPAEFPEERIRDFLDSRRDRHISNRRLEARKFHVVDLDWKDVFLTSLLDRARHRAASLVYRPRTLQVLIRNEHDAVARLFPEDLVEEYRQILSPEILWVELVVKDREARFPNSRSQFLSLLTI